MKCSIFDYPIEVYGVTGGLVKDNIITCGGRGFKTFYGKLKITLLDPESTVFHHNLNFKHICDKSDLAQRIQQPIPKLQILISTNLTDQIDFYLSNKIKLAVIGQYNS